MGWSMGWSVSLPYRRIVKEPPGLVPIGFGMPIVCDQPARRKPLFSTRIERAENVISASRNFRTAGFFSVPKTFTLP